MVERQLILKKAATILTISTDQFIPFQYSKKKGKPMADIQGTLASRQIDEQ